jgi:hypothetical protein
MNFDQMVNKINIMHEKKMISTYELTRADFRVLADWHLLMILLYKSEKLFRVAEELGLVMVEPDRRRGVYAGPMVYLDQQVGIGLVMYAREKAVELPFEALADGQTRPTIGNLVRMDFRKGELVVSVSERRSL